MTEKYGSGTGAKDYAVIDGLAPKQALEKLYSPPEAEKRTFMPDEEAERNGYNHPETQALSENPDGWYTTYVQLDVEVSTDIKDNTPPSADENTPGTGYQQLPAGIDDMTRSQTIMAYSRQETNTFMRTPKWSVWGIIILKRRRF